MRRFLVPALIALGLATSTVAVTAAPASAAYTTTISALDTSVAGHVSGTVTTDAPNILVIVEPDNFGSGPSAWLTPASGSASFDLETWGVASGKISVRSCLAQDWNSCESVIYSETFTPQTVEPVVTFPEDVTIGDGQLYDIQVDSDQGGGQLVAHWEPVDDYYEDFPLEVGSNEIAFYREGPGTLTIRRCGIVSGIEPCVATTASKELTVQREFDWTWVKLGEYSFSPALGQKAAAWMIPARGDDFTLQYKIRRSGQSDVLLQGTLEHLMKGSKGWLRAEVDVSSLPDGRYDLEGRLSFEDPEFGHQVGYGRNSDWDFYVDATAPVISSVEFFDGENTVAPVRDGFRDTVTARVKWVNKDAEVHADVVDSSGTVIDSVRGYGSPGVTLTWDGRTADKELAPAGTYLFRVSVTDDAGNSDLDESTSIVVVRKKLVHRTFKKTVTALGSYERQFAGDCSQVVKPSSHGWAGSLGIYSNTKCARGDAASFVETHHSMKLPKAYRYGSVRPMIYGAAAQGRAGSVAVLSWYKANEEWGASQRVGSCLRGCWGTQVPVSRVLHNERWLYWAAVTGLGHRWDVKKFAITMDYYVLVNE